ncbi:YlbF family regulator [Haloarcula nitratireducens]|uniref:YlbF family regulator n=1 Tax=Haloarcula nitratireducens TaxID=2487749 RepID=A0AAW4P9Q5_9EURY|nr:YlbF family regulator [Halomicroarcula nitratireducens]MBX0294027.1 YlbF family regulator [Halomicroarcula nitratireducens]
MSIESDTAADPTDDSVEELAAEFGEAITELPVYQRYLEAKEAVENHEEAQKAIQEFEQLREEFQLARQTGRASQEDLRKLQDAQEELHDIPVMSEYLQVQNDLELRLQELNELVSEQLTVDFGQKAGGCCED